MFKTVTFAATHFSVVFAVAYALTGSFGIASTLALAEPMVNTVAYHFHEKIWDRVRGQERRQGVDAGHARLCGHGH
ncbi:DUF2061 domain-containing protein [Jeongeupia chitinilytica]|uniref:DUF2061 domain-containing protein n=1 Tax=Jeongeupia chitinilytica TaxID=1041641 RepID=A0ABQ3H1P1_9NEIS|nr:DUF2061 domain-containing protein [Jeongeupia chitinilytica]GHD62955.1 hypothetical protein GCM10007350_19440 [Jeongeupia chitinilytica]